MNAQRMRRPPCLLLALSLAAGCSAYEPFQSVPHLESRFRERLPPAVADQVRVPYQLSPEVSELVSQRLSPAGNEEDRTENILAFIFSDLDLRYSLTPTRDASETFLRREGNCLSFVHLFVGIGRYQRLAPFYVEVEDYQRWNYSDGVVVSRGHIVAGLNVNGELSTYDFLPYRAKAYRDFEPIDDLTAMAHHYNNLGAEALIAHDLEAARHNLEIAVALAPDFEKAINNLGIVYLRGGERQRAGALYERGLALYPASVPLLTNLARLRQEMGQPQEAAMLLNRIEGVNEVNPFFFIYRGEVALAQGDTEAALRYMRLALRTDSENPEVHVGLAKVFLALGDLKRVEHHIGRALRLDATHDEARRYAAMLEGGQIQRPEGAGDG